MKLGSLLEKQFKKIGLDTTTDDLKAIIALDTEVPDDLANKLDKGLLTVEAAKSNSEVNKALRQSILGVADSKMDELIAELGLVPGDDFVADKNTYDKISKLTKLALDAGKESNASKDKGTADEWAKKEADYNKQIKDLKDLMKNKETEFATARENDLTTFELKTILSGKEYIFPKEMDSHLKISTALGAVNTELQRKGFSIKRDQTGNLIVVNKDGQPAYSDTNEAIKPDTFIDGALAQNKLLKINDPNQKPIIPGSSGVPIIPGAGNQGNAAVVAEIAAELQAMR